MTTTAAMPTNVSVLYWICRAVFLEAIRRREISAVLLFMGLFIIGAITARFVGSETDAAAAFILNLGLSLSWILSLTVSILLAARQFPDELEQRSIYPLLAKPVSRPQYLLGKWTAVTLAASATALVLNIIALAASPWPSSISLLLLMQGVLLETAAVATAAAIAIALSLHFPKAVAVAVTALLVFAGTQLVTITQSLTVSSSWRSVAKWLTGYIPTFGKLDLINAISSGMPAITALDFVLRMTYAGIVTIFALAVAMLLLERKPL